MKKKIVSIVLALALALSLAPSASALGAFADVTDAETARNVEVLRLMGVVEGHNGAFRPNATLTRAEFCKMAVVLTGQRGVVARYGSRTVFPDVKATHWAAGYVNYAASADAGLLHGMPDGTFAPDRAITYGEAVAILARQLGYTDADTGGVWPDGYLALADGAGMTVSASGNAAITRAQAAKLFVNALSSKNEAGETLASKLGYTMSAETTLYSVDLAGGKLRTKDKDYTLANPMASTVLDGRKGYVIANASGEALTFLPSGSAATGGVSDAAVIVSADKSTAGFDAITGGSATYAIYRNGVRSPAALLKRNDVATYSAASDAVLVCDTRVSVYYEACDPTPSAPTTITALGGTTFDVLPTARQSLAQFKPGQTMTLLLTADGRVAGASKSVSSNAFAYVDNGGATYLICGGSLIPLACSGSGYEGEVVRVSQSNTAEKKGVYLTKQSGGASGTLDLTTMTLGTRRVADGALVFVDGAQTSLAALGVSRVEQSRVAYARVNTAGEVDLIVVKDNTNAIYGRAVVTTREDGAHTIAVAYGNGKTSAALETGYDVANGAYVEATRNSAGDRYTSVVSLTKLAAVPASAWIGDTAVNYGAQTYLVYPESVLCYNRDGGAWFDDLAAAKAYGGTMDLYVKDGVVRAVEVRG